MVNINRFINMLVNIVFLSGLLVTMWGCSTTYKDSISIVDKNLAEGRLVPEAALRDVDILNEYKHVYMSAQAKTPQIRIDYDRKKVHTSGGEVLAQIALVTEAAQHATVNLHFLHHSDSLGERDMHILRQVLSQSAQAVRKYGYDSTLSLESTQDIKFDDISGAVSVKPKQSTGLKELIGMRVMQPNIERGDHFVVLLGSMSEISRIVKQDIIDMSRILIAKGAKLSVLSYGDKPDFALLSFMAKTGHGRFVLINDNFEPSEWANSELDMVHASSITDIEINIEGVNGSVIQEILSPSSLRTSENKIHVALSELMSGSTHVMLVKLKVPRIHTGDSHVPVKVRVSFYDDKKRRYKALVASKSIAYTMEKNETVPGEYDRIARSRLILDTQKTILDAAEYVREKRNYQAIAELVMQQRRLAEFSKQTKDRELERDAKVLNKFALSLQQFDESWFQTVKIWRDMNWDDQRFVANFE